MILGNLVRFVKVKRFFPNSQVSHLRIEDLRTNKEAFLILMSELYPWVQREENFIHLMEVIGGISKRDSNQ